MGPVEPGPEPGAIAKLTEAAIGLRERLLGDVLRILPLPEHAVGNPKRQPGGICQARLELTLERQVGRHKAARKTFGVLMHQASPRQDAARAQLVHCAAFCMKSAA
jgi:hypothetical protein